MTWVAYEDGEWHYLIKKNETGVGPVCTGCGILSNTESHANLFSGEEPPYFRVFDPPMPICQGCANYRTLNDLAE